MTQALLMAMGDDPKARALAAVGPYVDKMEPLGSRILVAVYQRPEMTKSGLILSTKTLDEDKYQGKVGLILKMGPLAFSEDDNHQWGEKTPKVGDWVVFPVGDTFPFEMGDWRCRCIEDVHVQMITTQPDAVY